MTVLRSLRALVLGETWTLPLAVAAVAGAALLLHELAPDLWEDAGAPLLFVAIPAVLVFAVQRSVTRR